jgi:hypothetical protein
MMKIINENNRIFFLKAPTSSHDQLHMALISPREQFCLKFKTAHPTITKGQTILVTGHGVLLGYETSRIPHFLNTRLKDRKTFPGLNCKAYFNCHIKAKHLECTEHHLSTINCKAVSPETFIGKTFVQSVMKV